MTNEAIPTVGTNNASQPANNSDADTDLVQAWAAKQAAVAPPVSSETAAMIAHILRPENRCDRAA